MTIAGRVTCRGSNSSVPCREIVSLILWSLGFAVLLVVLPIACLARLVTMRRFSLRTLLIRAGRGGPVSDGVAHQDSDRTRV